MSERDGDVLTLEVLQRAMDRIRETPKREVFLCKRCGRATLFAASGPTARIDGVSYYICVPCAFSPPAYCSSETIVSDKADNGKKGCHE